MTVSPMLHQDQERILVNVPYDPTLIQKIRTVSGAEDVGFSPGRAPGVG